MITVSKTIGKTDMRPRCIMPMLIPVLALFSYSGIKAQNDPRSNPGPVPIQKIMITKKTPTGHPSDSLIDVKITYYKPDSSMAGVDMVSTYTTAEKNNDPAITGKENKAVIYNEATQQQREASEDEVKKILEQVIQNPPVNFIYFIDDKESSPESVKKLNPARVKTINFLKNEDAVKKYGEKARSGVITLTTK
jgi:hypothetical protein